ncbi:MAG TPA: nuclear transport factor 2 family protein [Caulobacteraceae bacterium]|jgi:ketosteroid isomerase-like protein
MNTQEVAQDLVSLCSQGQFDEAGEKYWADDVVSVEPTGDNAESRGKAAARAKGEWWSAHHDVHGVKVEGPYVNGDEFTVRFVMDVTDKDNGQRMTMDEVALYRLKGGKIAEERFFYSA